MASEVALKSVKAILARVARLGPAYGPATFMDINFNKELAQLVDDEIAKGITPTTGMKYLQQDDYKDKEGNIVSASVVQFLAPWRYAGKGATSVDWMCGSCGFEHQKVNCLFLSQGQVLPCDGCGKINLLASTNCQEVSDLVNRRFESVERDKELRRLEGIETLNETRILEIKQELMEKVKTVVNNFVVKPKKVVTK